MTATPPPTLCAIVAMAQNRVIGGDNKLLWHLPEDLKHFKRTTMGCPLIMGRKTFESLPGILPGRPHIVISRNADALNEALKSKNQKRETGTTTMSRNTSTPASKLSYVNSLERAINVAQELATHMNASKIFIAGGGEIYRLALPKVEQLYLTTVHRDYKGDTTFPAIDMNVWSIISEDNHNAEAEKNRPAFTMATLRKIDT